MPQCRSCHAPILWRLSSATGKPMPLDPEPGADGNIRVGVIQGEVVAVVLGPEATAEAREAGAPLYRSHFVSCPNADEHRREG